MERKGWENDLKHPVSQIPGYATGVLTSIISRQHSTN